MNFVFLDKAERVTVLEQILDLRKEKDIIVLKADETEYSKDKEVIYSVLEKAINSSTSFAIDDFEVDTPAAEQLLLIRNFMNGSRKNAPKDIDLYIGVDGLRKGCYMTLMNIASVNINGQNCLRVIFGSKSVVDSVKNTIEFCDELDDEDDE